MSDIDRGSCQLSRVKIYGYNDDPKERKLVLITRRFRAVSEVLYCEITVQLYGRSPREINYGSSYNRTVASQVWVIEIQHGIQRISWCFFPGFIFPKFVSKVKLNSSNIWIEGLLILVFTSLHFYLEMQTHNTAIYLHLVGQLAEVADSSVSNSHSYCTAQYAWWITAII